MPTNIILLIAALIVALIIFRALLNFTKTAISTAITIFVVIVVLSVFGFTPQDLIKEFSNLPLFIEHLITEVKKLFGFSS
ncbi:hypothetical protein NIES4071_04740 [Calothrix sp. NIES-4071]|nr:hypothetical protein NIES4071_04740 [Calothrix sp. NIES-4071]BAZ54820.1 hypothetical protein NIES4105_04730 [Calothrix sp. NIES-4105]